jgi:hypothetical protein
MDSEVTHKPYTYGYGVIDPAEWDRVQVAGMLRKLDMLHDRMLIKRKLCHNCKVKANSYRDAGNTELEQTQRILSQYHSTEAGYLYDFLLAIGYGPKEWVL